ncbi:diguanylate cyclase [Thiohalocapsa marina]|uniref:diguanylate cyclase n=1 Tax=Thiohalocapsa marina TaxID=424902 RepID=UPI0036D81DDD
MTETARPPSPADTDLLGLLAQLDTLIERHLPAAGPGATRAPETLQRVLADLPVPIVCFDPPHGHATRSLNPRFTELFGYTLADIPSLTAFAAQALPDAAERAQVLQAWEAGFARLRTAGGTMAPGEYRLRCKDGSTREVRICGQIVADRVLIAFMDLTVQKRMLAELRLSERRHRLLADHAADVIWTLDLAGGLTYISPSIERLTGYTPQECLQLPLEALFAASSWSRLEQALAQARADQRAGRPLQIPPLELERRCKDGTCVWVELTMSAITDGDDRCVELLGISRDICARKHAEAQLQQARAAAEAATRALQAANAELRELATKDALTGAWNRRYFEHTAAAERTRAQRHGTPLSLILLDIDHFKAINDRFGHQAGDAALVALSALVRANLRRSDVLARWGGEEFALLLPHCDLHGAACVAEKLRAELAAATFATIGSLSASFGVGQLRPGETLDAWIKRVDDALYAAKHAGRNQVVIAGAEDAPVEPAAGALRLIWKPTYACGEPRIDQEHRELFSLANALIAAAGNPDSLLPALEAFMTHAVAHFAHEEAILRERGYADLDAHAAAHRRLIEHAQGMRAQAEAGAIGVGELVEFLYRDLVARHLLQEDARFFGLFSPSAPPSASSRPH